MLGLRRGTTVPQLVIHEHLRQRAGRGADEFLVPEMFSPAHPVKRDRHRDGARGAARPRRGRCCPILRMKGWRSSGLTACNGPMPASDPAISSRFARPSRNPPSGWSLPRRNRICGCRDPAPASSTAAAASCDRSRRSPPRRERPHIYGTKPIHPNGGGLGPRVRNVDRCGPGCLKTHKSRHPEERP